MATNSFYGELQSSARSVLRGVDAHGLLARVADGRLRRGLAAEFMQRDVNALLPLDWTDRLEAALLGTPMHFRRSLGDAGGIGEAELPDYFQPVCLYTWLQPLDVSEEVARMRRQALQNFPVPMFQAVWTAHSNEPIVRVRAAWEVLDAVDRGGKVVAPLARFLRVSRKAIKLSAKCHHLRPNEWVHYGRTRRTLRVLQAMWRIAPETLRRYRRFPEMDVLARTTGVSILTACLRIDEARYGRSQQQFAVRELWSTIRRIRRCRELERKERRPLSPKFALPCHWQARVLDSHGALRSEGIAMGHCVASHTAQVLTGERQVFALRSSDGKQRATVVIDPPLGVAKDADNAVVEIAGPQNGSLHPAALIAVGELLVMHGSHRIFLTGL